MQAGGHFSQIITKSFHFFETKLSKVIQKFVRVRKSVTNWSKVSIIKFEAVVFGVMLAVTI